MKKIIPILIIFLVTGCKYLTVCDAPRYQLQKKTELGGGMCEFKFYAAGDCLTWADRQSLMFIDKCGAYTLSQTVWKDDLKKKYGI